MALLPFASQTYSIKEQGPDSIQLVTNTGFSPLWIFVAGIALLQVDYLKYGLIITVVLCSGFRTIWVIDRQQNSVMCRRLVWGVVIGSQKLALNLIQAMRIDGVYEPRGRTEYALVLVAKDREITVAQRVDRDGVSSLREELKPFMPQSVRYAVDAEANV